MGTQAVKAGSCCYQMNVWVPDPRFLLIQHLMEILQLEHLWLHCLQYFHYHFQSVFGYCCLLQLSHCLHYLRLMEAVGSVEAPLVLGLRYRQVLQVNLRIR
jgi:hypothetical protein